MRKITFQTFLSGTPSRDYIFQKTPYEEQIMQAADMIKEADYVLMGVGAGLSTAAGAVYGGTWFQENFRKDTEMVHICKTCTVLDFIHTQTKNPSGATGLNKQHWEESTLM